MNTNNATAKYTIPLVINSEQSIQPKGITIFDSIIGQPEAIKKLKFFVGSNSINTPIPTMLFTGSQGLGKSFMADKVSCAIGSELITINCGTIETSEDFIEGVLINKVAGYIPKTLLLDEAHELSSEITTSLLTLLNPNDSNVNKLCYKQWIIEFDFSKINVILATTDAHRIFRPLLNRCEEVYFNLYSHEDLYAILKNYLPGITLNCSPDELSYACRGRARDAYSLAQNISRYCTMNKTKTFNDKAWGTVKDIFGVHYLGLKTQEVDLLKIISESEPISLTNLAVKMGLNTSNVESEIEIRPRELGLIENAARGRVLTSIGHNYVARAKNVEK